MLQDQGKLVEAEPLYQRSLAIREKSHVLQKVCSLALDNLPWPLQSKAPTINKSTCVRRTSLQERPDSSAIGSAYSSSKGAAASGHQPAPAASESQVPTTHSAPPPPPDLDDATVPKSAFATWLHTVAPAEFLQQHALGGRGTAAQLSKKNNREALVEACKAFLCLGLERD